MNLMVVPPSRTPKLSVNPTNAALGCAMLMGCIGLPISLLAHRHFSEK